jgi:hypothetical protein
VNIQELGSLGEFVSAIAVMATLIYLAIQTRLARKAAEETAEFQAKLSVRSVVDLYSNWRSLKASPEMAEILVKARSPADLSEKEQVLFEAVFEELFWTATSAYLTNNDNPSGPNQSVDAHYLLTALNKNPQAIEEWRRSVPLLSMFAPEFVDTVDALLEAQGEAEQAQLGQ